MRQPALLLRDLLQLRTGAGHGHKVLRVVEACGLECRGGFQHAVARLSGPARFGNHQHQRALDLTADFLEHVIDAVRIGVVEEMDAHFVATGLEPAERVAHQLRPERRTADADHKQLAELAVGTGDLALVDAGGEILDGGQRRGDGVRDFLVRRQLRRAQPVMADHAVLIGIGDGALLQRGHGGEGLRELRLQRGEIVVRERQAAEVERHAERGIVVAVLLETGPGHGESSE